MIRKFVYKTQLKTHDPKISRLITLLERIVNND